MDIKTRDVIDRIQERLRSDVNDPFNRGDNATETLTTGNTTLTLSNKKLKNVNEAKGASTENNYYRFSDFSISFDDPSDSNDYPEITFNSSQSEDVSIDYHYNETWIYPTWPSAEVKNALITIQHISEGEEEGYLGNKLDENTKGQTMSSSWQIDVWVGKDASVNDPDSNHSGYFSGGKLCDYIADRVKESILENQSIFNKQGITDVSLLSESNGDFEVDTNEYRKIMEFNFEHDYEW